MMENVAAAATAAPGWLTTSIWVMFEIMEKEKKRESTLNIFMMEAFF